jgi:hypothetical protein
VRPYACCDCFRRRNHTNDTYPAACHRDVKLLLASGIICVSQQARIESCGETLANPDWMFARGR